MQGKLAVLPGIGLSVVAMFSLCRNIYAVEEDLLPPHCTCLGFHAIVIVVWPGPDVMNDVTICLES